MTDRKETTRGLLVCGDLFFGSRVTGTANELGLAVDVAESAAAAAQRLEESAYRFVLVDLSLPGLDVKEVIGALPDPTSRENRPEVIAFGSHVMTEQLRAAREAGCDEVLPKSRFTSTLAEILRRYC